MGHPLPQLLNALDLTSVSRRKKKKASLMVQMVKRETQGSIPGSGRSLEKEMATHSSFLPGKSHGWRSLGGYSLWGHKDSDMTE